ncbi:MAG: aminotransferase class I/II-fold pyridoxal phosphate-dependent enzyme [Planctomycetes bacterium]|nr:aminotransferase class I/II-fold pyridoxal phosphate-dependent enzyme [Planctomycetota bacterium]
MATRRSSSPDVHLNLNVRGLSPSATLAINERSAALQAEGREVYRFGLGQSPFPVPRSVVEALRASAHEKDYLAVKGLHELRDAVAEYHRRKLQVDRAAEDVLIGPGSKELMFLLQLVYYGDLVIPTPSWVSYAPQASIIGRRIHWLDTDASHDWRMTPERLEQLCEQDRGRPRIVVLNYPSNPTGSTYNSDELKAIAAVARRHRVVLLSDEIYGELHFLGRHVSIARYYPEGTIVSTGLSKWCGAGGWRLGTFVFPRALRWLLDAMAVVASETYTSTSAPIQHAAVRAFSGGLDIENYLARSRRIVRTLGRECARRLRKGGVAVPEPKGGFYLLLDAGARGDTLRARGITGGRALCEKLLDETGVALLPGVSFGMPDQLLTARLAYVDFDGGGALAAAAELPPDRDLDGGFLDAHCGKVLRGIDRLVEWLRAEAA